MRPTIVTSSAVRGQSNARTHFGAKVEPDVIRIRKRASLELCGPGRRRARIAQRTGCLARRARSTLTSYVGDETVSCSRRPSRSRSRSLGAQQRRELRHIRHLFEPLDRAGDALEPLRREGAGALLAKPREPGPGRRLVALALGDEPATVPRRDLELGEVARRRLLEPHLDPAQEVGDARVVVPLVASRIDPPVEDRAGEVEWP